MIISESAPLSAVAKVIRGVSYDKQAARHEAAPGFVPIIRAGHISDELDFASDLIFVPSDCMSEVQRIRSGDIVMCASSGSSEVVGKSAIAEQDWLGSAGAFCVIIRASAGYDPHFLAAYLRSANFRRWTRGAAGINIKNIRKRELEAFPVPVVPLELQRRVATTLGASAKLQRLHQQAASKTRDLMPALFSDLFSGAPVANRVTIENVLADVPHAIRTGPFGSQLKHSEFTDHGFPVLGIDNAVQNRFRWAKPRHLPENRFPEFSRYAVRSGDVIITIMGTTGRVAVLPDDMPRAITTKHLCALTLDRERVDPWYLWGALLFDPQVKAQTRAAGNGAIMEGWNMGIVRSLKIALPPITRQRTFASYAQAVWFQSDVREAATVKADELLQSTLASVFGATGA